MRTPAKGKLKYQSVFPHCLDQKMNTNQVISYIRAKCATTAYGSAPKDSTIYYQWETFKKTGQTNLYSSRHEHKYYEHSKRQYAVQLTKYQVYSLLERVGTLTRTGIKKELGGNSDKRQVSINQLLEEGFISEDNKKLSAVVA